jgi:hypothetical protein
MASVQSGGTQVYITNVQIKIFIHRLEENFLGRGADEGGGRGERELYRSTRRQHGFRCDQARRNGV